MPSKHKSSTGGISAPLSPLLPPLSPLLPPPSTPSVGAHAARSSAS
jgi:hypothetical protein